MRNPEENFNLTHYIPMTEGDLKNIIRSLRLSLKEFPSGEAAALAELAQKLEDELLIFKAKQEELKKNQAAYIKKLKKAHFN